MKRKLSVMVLVAMIAAVCLGVLVACNSEFQNEALKAMLGIVDKEFDKAQGHTSYELLTTVSYEKDGNKLTCNINWEADNGVVISNGKGAVPAGVTTYTLKATLVGENGNKYNVDGNPRVKMIDVTGSPNQGGNDVVIEGSITPSQLKAEAASLNVADGAYSANSYKVVGYVVAVTPKTLSSATVYDIDIADTAGGEKQFYLYHLNLNGTDVPAVGDKILAIGFITAYKGSPQMGGQGTADIPYATVEVLVKGSGSTTTPPDSGNTGTGSETTTPESGVTVSDDGKTITFDMVNHGAQGSGAEFASLTSNGITITAAKNDGSNPPKYFDNNTRLYAKNTMTISATKTIKSVTLTFENYKNGVLSTGNATVTSDTAVEVNGASISFSVGDVGQIRITQIVVVFA